MPSKFLPIKVWGKEGPNPPKVAIVLEELGLPHEIEDIKISDVKAPEYLAINPNGRVPSIYDPNTDLTLWESGAIVEYLVEKYDTDHRISFKQGSKEAQLARQWLFFQATGQGPYYGQAAWFMKFHHEQLPSAKERYIKEMNRISGVVNDFLSKQDAGEDGPWLVGGKLSYADLAWVGWQKLASSVITPEDGYDESSFPALKNWVERMSNRESVRKVMG